MAKTKNPPGHGNKSGKRQDTTTTPPRVRELEKKLAECRAEREDLAMLVIRLARMHHDANLADKATGYLRRKGLMSIENVLRAYTAPQPSVSG